MLVLCCYFCVMKPFLLSFMLILLCLGGIYGEPPLNTKIKPFDSIFDTDTGKTERLLRLLDHDRSLPQTEAINSLLYANEALRLANTLGDTASMCTATLWVAKNKLNRKEFGSAITLTDRAYRWTLAGNLQHEKALSLINFGLISSQLEHYSKCTEYYSEALTISWQIKDSHCKALSLNGLVKAFYKQDDREKAQYYLNEAFAIDIDSDTPLRCAAHYLNMSDVLKKMDETDRSFEYLLKSLELYLNVDYRNGVGLCYLYLGNIYRQRNDTTLALASYQKALSIAKEIDNILLQGKCLVRLSLYYRDRNMLSQSLYYGTLAMNLADKSNLSNAKREASRILWNNYKEQNHLDSAYKYLFHYSTFTDTLNRRMCQGLHAKLELEHGHEILAHKKEFSKQNSFFNLGISSLALGFVAVLFLLWMFCRLRLDKLREVSRKKKYEEELELKNKEFTSYILTVMKKNELLRSISTRLLGLESKAVKKETKLAIKSISKEILGVSEKKIWDDFEVRFNKVNSGFFENLLANFPTLSPGDMKLCAFLKLNMSSKEISELTGQKVSSLENARYRLRKKLNIVNSDTNLVTFLSKY